MLQQTQPDTARHLMEAAQQDVNARWAKYQRLAAAPEGSQS